MAHVAQSFLISINDLPQHIRTWPSNIFAGDNAIYTTGKSFMETKCALQSSVYDAERWFDNSNLQINIKKTIYMLIAIESGCPRRAHVVSEIERHNSWTVLDHPVPWPSTRWQVAVGGTCSKVMLEYFFETCSSKQTAQSIEQKITLQTVYRMHTTFYWLCRFCLDFMLRAKQRLGNLNL